MAERKGRGRAMTASYSEKIHRHQTPKPKDRSLGHSQGIGTPQKKEGEENALHLQKCKEIFLQDDLYFSICPPKKKKGSAKLRNVALRGDGLVISDGKGEQIIPLNSLCMIIQEGDSKNKPLKSPRIKSSPFSSRSKDRDKETCERTMLLLTHDLTRIWIKFAEKKDFLQWVLSVDGLLSTFYSSSLLDTVHKTVYLRERYLLAYEGGSIKVGDDEEWTYIGDSGRLSCSLTTSKELKSAVFTFDGQYFRPDFETQNQEFCGEWDGMNVYWYKRSTSGEQSERKRRQTADSCYNWNHARQEFHLIEGNSFAKDTRNTWALTRNFLARTDGMGAGWIQIEGDTPVCLAMFLCLFYASNSSD